VFLQESGPATDGTFGYELFVQEIAPSDAAILNITYQAGFVVISWPGSLTNYQCQSAGSMAAPSWQAVNQFASAVEWDEYCHVGSAGAQIFYRLQTGAMIGGRLMSSKLKPETTARAALTPGALLRSAG